MSRLCVQTVTQATGAKHTGTVIFFHGSGGTGETMKEWVRLLTRSPFAFPHLKIVYPTAPLRPYTPLGGDASNVWFDRLGISPDVPEDADTLKDISLEIQHLIKGENELGIPNNRIIVGGFSMGGALALHIAYRWNRSLAGAFCFSSFLNNGSGVYEDIKAVQDNTLPPLLQLHGDIDDVVDYDWGKGTFDSLKKLGISGEFHTLEKLRHSPNRKGLEIIKSWIEKLLPQDMNQ